MLWLTDNFLFDVTVLVATLQSPTSRGQFYLADDKNHDNQFSLDSARTKEGKERLNNEDVHTTQNFPTNRLTPSPELWNNLPVHFRDNLSIVQLLFYELRWL